jgi:hypothetical protein
VADGVCDRARERDERFENGDERERVTKERKLREILSTKKEKNERRDRKES